LSQKVYMDFWV